MTDERKEELRLLMKEAMKTLRINSPEQYRSISVEKYKEYSTEFRTYYSPDLSFLVYCRPNVQNDMVKSKLLDFLKRELGEFIDKHGWIHPARTAIRNNNLYAGCPISALLEKLLEIAIASGVEKAISALDKCTKETKGSFRKIIFLQGFTCKPIDINEIEEIPITEGIRLVAFPFSLPDLSPYLYDERFSPISRSVGAMNFQLKTLLIIDYSVSPLFCKPTNNEEKEGNPFQIDIESVEFPNFNVEKFCQAFSLSSNYAVEPLFEWNYIDENELFNLRGGVPIEICNFNIPTDKPKIASITEAHIDKAKNLYKTLTSSTSNLEKHLHIPIDRWRKSKTSQAPEDKMIDLGIAFESLYLPKNKTDQLAFQFRLRASWHLGKDKEHRKRLMDEFKAIYDLRSMAVHNGVVSEKIKIRKGEERIETSEFIKKAQDLCRKSIIKILEDGEFPAWKSLILGEESS